MPTTRRSRIVGADPKRAWDYAADPSRLPRWWPNIERVERSSSDDYTRWALSPRGRAVPMHFRLGAVREGSMVTWAQEIEGTIFSRSLKSATETLLITDDGSATKVQLEIKRKMRGTAKLGALFVARAQKRELDAALDHLEAALDG